MTLFEARQTSAYGDDLRWRMVWQKEALKYSYEEVGSNLGVDRSTVVRVVELFRTTGKVSKRQYPKERAARELTAPGQLFILHLVVQRPGIYLHEVQKELEDFLMNISVSTICRFLHASGFTHQRLRTVASQQDIFHFSLEKKAVVFGHSCLLCLISLNEFT